MQPEVRPQRVLELKPGEPSLTVLYEEAADWVLRLDAHPGDAEVRREFEDWLSEPGHEAVWTEVAQTWARLKDLGEENAAAQAAVPVQRPRCWSAGWVAAGAVAIFAAWLVAPTVIIAMTADYSTETAQRETVHTDDGSVIDLAGASAITVDIGPRDRRVRLLKGEAFFEVATDANRPFIVDASGLEVTVHGTAFNVLVTSKSTTLALLHGSVEVASEEAGKDTRFLQPGEKITVSHQTGKVVVGAVTPDEIGSWRHGLVYLDDVTLAEAANILERYQVGWISIPSGDLAARKVSGLIDLQNADDALALLVGLFGASVRDVSPYLRLVTR